MFSNLSMERKRDDDLQRSDSDHRETTVSKVFVSEDPAENEDNDDPEWELLRKLETDEQRYKAVRERWRNIVVPDPNKNLTYRARGGRQRKRPADDAGEQPAQKRRRTQSCTAVLYRKFLDIESSAEETQRQIRARQFHDLERLRDRCKSHDGPDRMDKGQAAFYVQSLVDLRRKVEEQIRVANKKRMKETAKLKECIEEVKLFNKFYEGLQPGLEDAQLLSDAEVQELADEEDLYKSFAVFYRKSNS